MKRRILICSLALVFTFSLIACSAADMGSAPTSANDAPSAPMDAPADSDFAYESDASAMPESSASSTDAAPPVSDGSPGPLPILTPSESGDRRLVYSVSMQLQTTEFMQGIRLLYNTIGEMDGFIVNENVQGRDLRTPEYERSASYTFRLYTDNLPDFIVVIEDNFNLLSRNLASDDVTTSYEQMGFSLQDLREHERSLQNALGNPELDDSDRLDFEVALIEVQSHIRSIEQQRSVVDDDILFSFINVQIFEVNFFEDAPELTFGERVSNAASISLGGLIGFGQGLLIVIIRILPTLIILGAVTVITIWIVRKVKKYNASKPKKPEPPQPQQTGNTNYGGYQNWNQNAHNTHTNHNTPKQQQ